MLHIFSKLKIWGMQVEDSTGDVPSKCFRLYSQPLLTSISISHRWWRRKLIMDSIVAHCDKRRHSWVMWSYHLFVFNVQDRSSHSHKRSPLSLFSASENEFYRARFSNKIPFPHPKSCCKWIMPEFSFHPSVRLLLFVFECYGRVKIMNAFLKKKTLHGLAQANWNYSKLFVKLNCNNIANTI